MSLMWSGGSPSVSARFGFESPSIASTFLPARASTRASVPEIEVLPEPPFPAIASFTPETLVALDETRDRRIARSRDQRGSEAEDAVDERDERERQQHD